MDRHPQDLTEEAIDREIEALRAQVRSENEQFYLRTKALNEMIAALWLCKKSLGCGAS